MFTAGINLNILICLCKLKFAACPLASCKFDVHCSSPNAIITGYKKIASLIVPHLQCWASEGHNPLAQLQNLLGLGYDTRLSLYAQTSCSSTWFSLVSLTTKLLSLAWALKTFQLKENEEIEYISMLQSYLTKYSIHSKNLSLNVV